MEGSSSANEESVNQQRKKWIKFDEESSTSSDLPSTTEKTGKTEDGGSASAAALSVDNIPSKTIGKSQLNPDEYSAAVIDATQVHINIDKKGRLGDAQHAAPIPAPRTFPPIALNRSQSTPAEKSPLEKPPPLTQQDRQQETVIQVSRFPPHSNSSQRTQVPIQRLQNVPLQEGINGSRSTRSGVAGRQDSIILRHGFANGDVIVSLYPSNEKCPWITPAKFRPELVPEELMADELTLTIEEYVNALEVLVNDFRFNCYNMCYKRILLIWILFGFIVLLALLFSGVRGLGLFGGGVVWLLLNAMGIFVSMWLKMKMSHHLEKCLASVNKYFLQHKILVGLDDKGKLSCHKVNLIFLYFDCTDCIKKLNDVIDLYDKEPKDEQNSQAQQRNSIQSRMDIGTNDVIITGSSNTRVSRKQSRAEKLLLRYSQRWVKEYTRHRLDLTVDVHERNEGDPPAAPRHCIHARCPCQFIEEHLKYKPRGCQACLDVASIPTILAPSYL